MVSRKATRIIDEVLYSWVAWASWGIVPTAHCSALGGFEMTRPQGTTESQLDGHPKAMETLNNFQISQLKTLL